MAQRNYKKAKKKRTKTSTLGWMYSQRSAQHNLCALTSARNDGMAPFLDVGDE